MADVFIELMRVEDERRRTPVLVNLGSVAWIESGDDGTSRIVFAAGSPDARESGDPLAIIVRESVEEIALLAGVVRTTDREAIAQAWVDQSARRGRSAEDP